MTMWRILWCIPLLFALYDLVQCDRVENSVVYFFIFCSQHPPSKSQDHLLTWLLKAWFCTCNLRNLFSEPHFLCITFWGSLHTLDFLPSFCVPCLFSALSSKWLWILPTVSTGEETLVSPSFSQTGRESPGLPSSCRPFFSSIPVTAHTSSMQQWVWSRGRGEILGRNYWTQLRR